MRVPDAPLDGAFTTIRSAAQDDVDLLVTWHADPDVARYWDGETFTREEMLLRLARPNVDPYVVMDNGEPVGYLQVWNGRAIAAWKKAGFQPVEEYGPDEEHTAPWLLMAFDSGR
jgi:hypothetical protein